MTSKQIAAARPADKAANPWRYCRKVGCLLHDNGEGYCALHSVKEYCPAHDPRREAEERCPPRE